MTSVSTIDSTTDLCYTSAAELLDLYRRRSLSPVEITGALLDRIEALNPRLNAYLHVDREYALRQARAAEAAYLAGSAAPLAGVPVSIKDLVNVQGMPTTFGSLLYDDFMPDEDAYSVARLRSAGAVFPGKTNTPEFGSLPTNENRLGDSARNPWKLSHTPGGSSGGAASAVAAGLAPIGLGTDFGGSIRIPAAMCGVFGVKPTLGRIARDTSFNLTGEFFSHEGPLSRTVLDSALFLDVCAGPDPRDRFSQIGAPPAFAALLEALPRGLRVAWTPDLGFATADAGYLAICERAVRAFTAVTGEIEQDTPDGARAGIDGWRVAGAAGNYSAERAHKQKQRSDLLTEVVRRGIDMPEQTTLAQYFDAISAVRTWRESVAAFFERYDLLLTPALITSDVAVGARELRINDMLQHNTIGLISFTAPFNATGTPVAVVPCGFTDSGLPVALQIAGKFGADLLVMQASRAFEQALPWAGRRPPLQDA
jgi:Asp-tRNA(Asn)/Glu-tRNA(Gln) amidotransferase A subunit family amidase